MKPDLSLALGSYEVLPIELCGAYATFSAGGIYEEPKIITSIVGPDGKVFAVAWNGPAMPNLREALGKHFEDFAGAAKSRHAGHNRLELKQDDLVVESSGHMRAFAGRAYLASEVPTGVDVGALR